ncbi:hypothetical protein KR51_00026100 [Rubidibacter lacunae KORDI 51-2]|uniref:Uncharacterized protein n=1 Tax=Rubidibacter lacunae KORDI 51-2 TaxID=582515 RepID=U5DIY4_9CHRO|nr:hypothetical protein [Rubidibacter lacunae]ERN40897.1 hypothetical protein KR51_00026100 [Rubidibacter lacunae KORDI 51-2]
MAGLLFLTANTAQFFTVSLRPDSLPLLLTLLGLAAVTGFGPYRCSGAFCRLGIAAT